MTRLVDWLMVHRISLDVTTSEVICLIGASGSGKSTLLRCSNLLEPIDDGVIELDGLDISEPGLDDEPTDGPASSVRRSLRDRPSSPRRRPRDRPHLHAGPDRARAAAGRPDEERSAR